VNDVQLAAFVRMKVSAANNAIREAQRAGLHVDLRVVSSASRPFCKELWVRKIERFFIWEDVQDAGDHDQAVGDADPEHGKLQFHEG
jgi:hypothetical protein